MLPNIIPPPTITWPIVVQRFPSLGRLGWGFILAFRPGVLSARMWKRGCCSTKTLVLPRRLYRTRDRCAVPKTLLQCVCTQRRNRIGRLSSFSEYAPTARAIKPDSAAKALWICQGSSPQRRRHVVLDVEVIPTDSWHAAPHCHAPSSCYPQLLWVLRRVPGIFASRRCRIVCRTPDPRDDGPKSYPKVMIDGDINAGAWSCGMVVGLIHDIPTVKELINRLMAEAEHLIRDRLVGFLDHSGPATSTKVA